MALSLESSSPSPSHIINKEYNNIFMNSSPPLISPSSEKRFWSALQNRVDTLIENRKKFNVDDLPKPGVGAEIENGKGVREDCLLLLRGFDSISSSLSQLTSNIGTALQGARDLAKPSLIDALHDNQEKIQSGEEGEKVVEEENRRGEKRKIDSIDCPNHQEGLEKEEDGEQSLKNKKLKKAKNLAVSMATKAISIARELKSIKSDLSFMQDRCALLEEENRRLREGYGKGIRHEEDDLVRLQLEALLAEKSRLANENANLTRENQCLHELVEYHQLTSQELSASYEQVLNGMGLDFEGFSPPQTIVEEENSEDGVNSYSDTPQTPRSDTFGFSTPDEGLDEQKN